MHNESNKVYKELIMSIFKYYPSLYMEIILKIKLYPCLIKHNTEQILWW
jgi:hypothetical protein